MRLVALVLLCGAASASAQSALYRPLAVGNEWTYQEYGAASSAGSCPSEEYRRTVRARVVRDTVLSGAEARVVQCDLFNASGVRTGGGPLVVPIAYGPNRGGTSCEPLFPPVPPSTSATTSSVAIGGTTYAMGSTASLSFNTNYPSGGFYQTSSFYGDRVGQVRYSEWRNGPSQAPSC